MEKTDFLGSGSIGRLLFRLSVPTIAAQLINVLYNIVDRVYIGHLPLDGANALAGLGVCFPIIMTVTAFSSLIGMGGAPRASMLLGRKDPAGAERTMGACFTALVIVGAVLTAVLLIWGRELLLIFGASDDTIEYAAEYMKIYALGTIPICAALGMNAFITAQGFTAVSMLSVAVGAVCNIALDPLFIFGFNMGVRGAALATVISQLASCVWVTAFLLGKKTALRIKRENLAPRPGVLLPCLALGVSPFVMQSTEGILSICFNTSLRAYGGDTAVGAMAILSSVMQFSLLPLHGLCSGAQPIVSYNYGAGNALRVRKTFFLLLKCCVGFSFAVWGAAELFPGFFASLFSDDAALVAEAAWALRIYMGTICLFGAQIACQQTFVAIGCAGSSVFLALLRKAVLLIPLIYILPNFFDDKVFAVLLAEPITDFLAVCVTVTLFSIVFSRRLSSLPGQNTGKAKRPQK